MKFLIVADNSDLIQYISNLIVKQNDEFLLLNNPNQFNQTIISYQPNWILVDLIIKEANGFDIAEKIKKNYPQMNTCLLSDSKDEKLIQKSKQINTDLFISKENLFEFYKIINGVNVL